MVRLERIQDLLEKADLSSATLPRLDHSPSGPMLSKHLRGSFNTYSILALLAEERREGRPGLTKDYLAETLAVSPSAIAEIIRELRQLNIVERIGTRGCYLWNITSAALTAFERGELCDKFEPLSNKGFQKLFSESHQSHLALLRRLEYLTPNLESPGWISARAIVKPGEESFIPGLFADLKCLGLTESIGETLDRRRYRFSPRFKSWLREDPELLSRLEQNGKK